MSKSQLRIVFDREDRTYHFGEQVSGKVILEALDKITCRRIWIEYGWRTHGKGNIDKGNGDFLKLQWEEAHFLKGEQKAYPFLFTAPNGPVTYHGVNVNVDWYIHAQADIPKAPDIKHEEDILLLPSEAPPVIILGDTFISQVQSPTRRPIVQSAIPPPDRQLTEPARDYFVDWGKFLIILLLISPLGATAILVTGFLTYPNLGWASALAVLAMVAVACVLIYGSINVISDIISKKKLEVREIRVEPQQVYTGEQLSCQLQFASKGVVYLDSIGTLLTAEEEVISGGGTNVKTYKHTAYKQSYVKQYKENLMAGRWISLYCQFTIPPSAPATFIANNNKVLWSLKLKIRFKGWRSWIKTIPITVLPGEQTLNSPASA